MRRGLPAARVPPGRRLLGQANRASGCPGALVQPIRRAQAGSQGRRRSVDRSQKEELVTSLQHALVRHRLRRRHPPDRYDGRGGDGAAAADACSRCQLQSDEEPARPPRPRRHEIRAALADVHRTHRDRFFAGPGGRGEGSRRVRQQERKAAHRRGRPRRRGSSTRQGVKALATLPSLDQLRAKLLGLLQTPATRIAAVLQAPGGQLARVLGAYAKKAGQAA